MVLVNCILLNLKLTSLNFDVLDYLQNNIPPSKNLHESELLLRGKVSIMDVSRKHLRVQVPTLRQVKEEQTLTPTKVFWKYYILLIKECAKYCWSLYLKLPKPKTWSCTAKAALIENISTTKFIVINIQIGPTRLHTTLSYSETQQLK